MRIRHILLTVVVAGVVSGIFWVNPPNLCTPIHVAGLTLLAVGFVFWTVARFQLGSSFTVRAQARKLVTGGVYSKIRNPIYIAGSFMIAGCILLADRPKWLFVFVLLIPLQLRRAHAEAGVLEEKFGDEYRQYRAGTWF